jgi:hypothetical protein
MTTIKILPEKAGLEETTYRAVAGRKEYVGKTAGEPLDGLTSQLDDEDSGTLVIVQHLRPDRFFIEEQQRRLEELMSRWRNLRDEGSTLTNDEQAELESLVNAELLAARYRAEAAIREIHG